MTAITLGVAPKIVLTGEAFYWIAIGLLLAPLPAGAFAWRSWLRTNKNRTVFWVLIVVSASYLLQILDLVSRDFVGPDYSARRIWTIQINVALGLLMLLVSAIPTHPQRALLSLFSFLVTLAWLQLASVAFVV